jgi:tRNA1Val (adenine37-N6)-methyltransferase
MANAYFQFKQFTIHQDRCAMKVTTDGCLFGAWCAEEVRKLTSVNKATVPARALDIGAGTGLLSLMVAQKNALSIQAVEIDADAAAQAAENAATAPFRAQIQVVQRDVLHLQDHRYDVIFSNPPFYEHELKSGNTARDTAHHSRQLTWTELFGAINRLLAPDGVFFLLLPYKRAGELEGYLKKEQLFLHTIVRVQQSTRHTPFRIMVQGSRAASPLRETELSIRDEHQQYTPSFVDLLKEYYLYL